ncbi:hypothetical protein RDI58_020227 [Solanum bulbocastanum]|uniref:Uncharacterized protein n=1 Tax=Solanum bulbocastanum TaxID=147425 RepID=A0AAN8TBP4_SOLBU
MMEEMTGLQVPVPSRAPPTVRHTMLDEGCQIVGVIGTRNDFPLLCIKSMRNEAQDLKPRAKKLQMKSRKTRRRGKGDIQREKGEAAHCIALSSVHRDGLLQLVVKLS